MTNPDNKPRIVCISGSMRFEDEIREAAREESAAGAIVVLPLCNMKQPHRLWTDPADVERLKTDLDRLHLAKIDLADEVLVVAPGGYIGDSTRAEIAYAEKTGKPVRYREHHTAAPEPVEDTDTPCWDCKGSGCARCSAAPSMVDSMRERIMRALADVAIVDTPKAADIMLAALPELAEVEQLREELKQADAFGRGEFRVTTSAYETACEALEKRRAALVEALELPSETSFYEAVGKAAQLRAKVEWLKARVLDEARAHSTATATLGKVVAEQQRLHVGAHVEVKPHNGKPFLGTVLFADGVHLWVTPDDAPNVAGRYLPDQLAVIT